MLRQNNLDDMRFDVISERARMSISEYFPAWSDLNTHDPGVTLIELFAWLTEMQRFHMDQSEDAEPFLPLLGIEPHHASAAGTEIEIQGGFAPRSIPGSTPLYAEDVRFETAEDIWYDGTPTLVRIVQRETMRTPIELGFARGYPNESFTADTGGQTILSIALTVAGEEWTMSDGFRASRPEDRHYTLNRETGEIVFGDGLRGALAYGEVTVTELTLTRGPDGNIAPDRITEFDGLPVCQPKAAEGGVSCETVTDALRRSSLSLRRAVTAEDIERIVLETPELDVLQARAFNMGGVPRLGEPRVIGIAVKLLNGTLTEDAKRRIRERLEPYRLVCRDFNITVPNIVCVSLRIELNAGPHGANFEKNLEESIRTFFGKNYSGFGTVLRVSEFCAFLTGFPEVLDVTHCVFRAYGGAKISADGDVTLEADSLAELCEISVRLH